MAGLKQVGKDEQPTLYAFLLLLPLLLVLPVVVLLWQQQFDGLYGQDAYAYFNYATGTLRQSLRALEPLPPFYWPPGYPLLIALVSFITGPTPLVGQIVSLVFGGLVVVFTGLLAYELHSPDRFRKPVRAYLAGLVVALTPQLWQSSAVVMPDTTALASATLGVWALARYGRLGRGRWLALASAALAFAVLTRLAYAPLALPCTVYGLVAVARRPRRTRLLHMAGGLTIALIILAPLLAQVPDFVRFQTSDFLEKSDFSRAPFLANVGDVSWDVGHALQNEFVTPSGRQEYRLPNGLYYALAPAHRYYFTPLLIPFLLIGLWRLWKGRGLTQGLLLAGWPAVIYISLVSYPFQNFRFTLGFLPPLAIIVVIGLQGIASYENGIELHELARMADKDSRKEIRVNSRQFGAKALAYLPLAGALLWMAYGGWTLSESFMARKEDELVTVRWVQQQVEPRAQLYTFAITLAFEQYSGLQVHDLYGLDPPQIGALLKNNGSTASRTPAYLLLDVQNVETQWAQHAPGHNYRWLEQDVGLTRLGQRRQYTLFRVEQGGNDDLP